MQGSDYETQCDDNSPPGHLNQMSQKVRLSQLFVIGSNIKCITRNAVNEYKKCKYLFLVFGNKTE